MLRPQIGLNELPKAIILELQPTPTFYLDGNGEYYVCPPPENLEVTSTDWFIGSNLYTVSEADPGDWLVVKPNYIGSYPAECTDMGDDLYINFAQVPSKFVQIVVPVDIPIGEYGFKLEVWGDFRNMPFTWAEFEIVTEVINPPGPDDPICQSS